MEGVAPGLGQVQKVRVPVSEFGSKFQTKTEAFNFVSQEMKAYCPPKDVVTAFHLKDMISGSKGYVKGADIQHLSVPQYESLSLERILDWANHRHGSVIKRMFPIDRELRKFPRQVSWVSKDLC